MIKFKVGFLAATFLCADLTLAAIPSNMKLKAALDLPLSDRLVYVNRQGIAALHELNKIAFDKTETLDHRWRAFTAMARSFPKDSQPFLARALKSQEWFMRNAALVVLPYGDRGWAVQQALEALDDSALIVRTAAVRALRQLHATEVRQRLWVKLNDRMNFHNGEPLWIRRHIIEALEQFTDGQDRDFFRRATQDKDPAVREVSKRVLAALDQRLSSRSTTPSKVAE